MPDVSNTEHQLEKARKILIRRKTDGELANKSVSKIAIGLMIDGKPAMGSFIIKIMRSTGCSHLLLPCSTSSGRTTDQKVKEKL